MIKLAAVVLMLIMAQPISIRVFPSVVMVGQGVGLTCKVTPHPDNRQLKMGFKLWQASERQLEGEAAPITWNMIFGKVPCEPGEAFCAVIRSGGKVHQVTTGVEVKGCEP